MLPLPVNNEQKKKKHNILVSLQSIFILLINLNR